MPIESILNAMQAPAPPLLSEQRNARDLDQANAYSTIKNNMLQSDIRQMALDQEREKRSFLKTFQGDVNSKEFMDQMTRIDPDLVIKMRESLAKLSTAEQEAITTQMDKVSAAAMYADTPEKWKELGLPGTFKDRDKIISMGMTMQQAMSYGNEMWSRDNMKPGISKERIENAKKIADDITGGAPRNSPEWIQAYQDELNTVPDLDKLTRNALRGTSGTGRSATSPPPAPSNIGSYKPFWEQPND